MGPKLLLRKEQKFKQQKIHFNTSVKLRKSTQKIISVISGLNIKYKL